VSASTSDLSLLEAVLRRDRMVIVGSVALVIIGAWVWLVLGAGTGMRSMEMSRILWPRSLGTDGGMSGMAGMAPPPGMAPMWTPSYAAVMFAMWWVMMVAMMLPGAAPVLLLFARVNRSERGRGRPYVPTGLFAAGYLAVWGAFSLIATTVQWGLDRLGLLSPMMATTEALLGGVILIAAGLWQLTPVKRICLRHCRTPLSFLMNHWRPGRWGAFRMGLGHGAYCVGCCWFLMALLFVGGIMNLFWVAGLSVFILLEKMTKIGSGLGKAVGGVLSAAGVVLIATSI
jgi:predicted metal-binding membrane protein